MKKIECRIERRIWDPGDTYLVIPLGDVQVFEEQGWKQGERVVVTYEVERLDK